MRIALDDFGSTDTSLSTLTALDVDIVKVAPALVDALDRLPRTATVISSLVQMADSLNAVVIAEGVERPGQLDMLRHLGVPLAQGYLLGVPHLDTDTLVTPENSLRRTHYFCITLPDSVSRSRSIN
ncbi:EAL domain-containing protein [Rhodococcus sp. SORGH_AS_0303]|uniref:EAL domain-containing protein n=1 Tax=Rhodococcus sp. SORGH_AS_0303 TaxID=3041753 RepID=UPI002782AF48|nr:EAL domain-containing protein [Rhodococcus sp. SORGH_AS_0303]MDQ1203207.1 EAL domain-containing protein (putative c-di-GMP-specific phosphodiesterase class I) [Rhodococcus sp. SORGH_AS_0303]